MRWVAMSRSSCTEPRGPARRRLLLLLSALTLPGCGVKGRLELPEKSASDDAEPEEDTP